MVVACIAFGCGPQVAVDDGGTVGGSGEDAGTRSTSDGRPGASATGGAACDVDACPSCGVGCWAEIECERDARPFCSCACGAEEGSGVASSSGRSDEGEVTSGGLTDGGEVTTDGGEDTSSCVAGTQGCACTPEGECNPGFACDENLHVCFLDVCPVGTESCPCAPMGACDPRLQCSAGICIDPGPPCPEGTSGCPCAGEGECDPDLQCVDGMCGSAEGG